jgi:hypothetical protein
MDVTAQTISNLKREIEVLAREHFNSEMVVQRKKPDLEILKGDVVKLEKEIKKHIDRMAKLSHERMEKQRQLDDIKSQQKRAEQNKLRKF